MEIFQLKEFTSLIETLSFSETSFQLNISDSALSRHIQLLEKELGGKLLDRTTRSITITDFGKEFLPYALKILKDYEDGITALKSFNDAQSGFFHLGAYYAIDEYEIGDYIRGFMDLNPSGRPIISFGNMEELEKGFKAKEFNVYTSVNNPEIKDFQFLKVGECIIKAVVSEKSPLATKSTISITDLEEYPLFLPGIDSPFCKTILKGFKDSGINAKVMYYGRFEDSIDFIRNEPSVALFHFRSDEIPAINGLVFKDFEPSILFDYGISYRDKLNDWEFAFVEYMRDIAKKKRQSQ